MITGRTAIRYWNFISPAEQIDNARTKSTTNALSGNLVFADKAIQLAHHP